MITKFEEFENILWNEGVDVIHLQKPEPFSELFPLQNKIYVIDNYLPNPLWMWLNEIYSNTQWWAKTNRVADNDAMGYRYRTGLPHHELWGCSVLVDNKEDISLPSYPDNGIHKLEAAGTVWLNNKLQTDFGFVWKRFQYAGLNSQVSGMYGTVHTDCGADDNLNCSFLYYYNTFWFDEWGGNLNLYRSRNLGLTSTDLQAQSEMIGSVEFKPNRLLIFDGRVPHQADSPNSNAKWVDRKSLVVRGEEIIILDEEERFYADIRV